MNRKLYVGNLPFETTEADLNDLFGSTGGVSAVNVICDRDSGRPRGFAFVEMATDEAATSAIETLNNATYGGRNLTVNLARPMSTDRDGAGSGRGPRRSQSRY